MSGTHYYPHWSDEDIAFLRDNLGEMNFAEIAKALDRTVKSIKRKAMARNLVKRPTTRRVTAPTKCETIRRPTTIEWAKGRSPEVRYAVFLRLTAHTPSDEHTCNVWSELFPGVHPQFTDDTTDAETLDALHRAGLRDQAAVS